MKLRRVAAVVCYMICLGAYGTAGYVSWLSYSQDISYYLGFLLFLPVWIVSYWFSTFFSQLCEIKKGEKTTLLLDKGVYRALSYFSNMVALGLLIYWVYIYFFLYKGEIV